MQIESIIRRRGGTTNVVVNGNKYVFSSAAGDPRQIADVTNQADIAKLLAIKQGYREVASPRLSQSDATKKVVDQEVAGVLANAASALKGGASPVSVLKPGNGAKK